MTGLVESFAATIGWKVCKCNVIVEGTSDVSLFGVAAELYYERHQTALLGEQIAILAAGKGDDGGVDGLNRRLNAARQIADADRGPDGSLLYRFIGLFDNDHAGRRAITNACAFDRRLLRYGDLFLLHPVMPLANGVDHLALRQRFEAENAKFAGLDWEVEDLLSEKIISEFSLTEPNAIISVHERGGRKHHELTRQGKYRLHKYVRETAVLEDVKEVVKLICSLRDYLRLGIEHIVR